jgi:hypothetical protein
MGALGALRNHPSWSAQGAGRFKPPADGQPGPARPEYPTGNPIMNSMKKSMNLASRSGD